MPLLVVALLAMVASLWLPEPSRAQSVAAVFKKVAPSVVVIRARGRDVSSSGLTSFKEIGSGVLISPDAKVMTAAHVVQSMDEITVEFIGGEIVPARVVASEPAADLSLLQLAKMPLGARVATLADSDTVQVGDQVIIIGAPHGLSYAMTAGWISARWPPNTIYRGMPLAEFFQTDAVINVGNSGGPMFNMQGEVIGLVSHNISKSGGSDGLGFVVTVNTAKQLLLEERSFWSGLEGQVLTDEQADILNLPPRALGYIVRTVAKGSPADVMGIKGGTMTATIGGEQVIVGGDIILSVEGIPLGNKAAFTQIRQRLNGLAPGSSFKVSIMRRGQLLDLTGRTP